MLTRTRRPKTESTRRPGGPTKLPPFHNEPPTDFARAENREAMRRALDEVRGQLGRRYPLSIGGEEVDTGVAAARFGQSQPELAGGRPGRRWPESNTPMRRSPRPERPSRRGRRRRPPTGPPS